MPIIAPVLLVVFLAAAVVAVFAFLSVVVWVTTPSHERQVRDRLALLKSLVEHPSENATQVPGNAPTGRRKTHTKAGERRAERLDQRRPDRNRRRGWAGCHARATERIVPEYGLSR